MRGHRSLPIALAVLLVACGGGRREAAPGGSDAAAPAARAAPGLLDVVPADAAVVLAILEPLPRDAWDRLAWDLAPFVARLAAAANGRLADAGVTDPVERLEAALIAELPGPVGHGTRAVFHELRGVGVLRIEVEGETALDAAVARAFSRAGVPIAPVIEGADGALAVVRTGRILSLAAGEAAKVREVAPILAGDAPLGAPTIDRAAVLAFGGHLDLGALARQSMLRVADQSPACQAATNAVLAELAPHLPKIVFTGTIGADRAELTVTADLDPAIAAVVAAPPEVTPGVPPAFPGRPIVGLSFVAPAGVTDEVLSSVWTGPLLRLTAACDTGAKVEAFPTDGNVRGGAFVFYDATTEGWFPTDLQAYVTVLARDPAAMMRDLAGTVPGLRVPPDTGTFVAIPTKDLQPFVLSAHAARKGEAIVLAVGKTGKQHAATALAAAEPPPIVHLFLDLARITKASDKDADAINVQGSGLADEAGLGDALARLVDTFDLVIGPHARLVATFQPPAAEPAPIVPSPRRAAAIACRRILDRGWESAKRSLARLGITTGLDAYEERFKSGFDTSSFIRKCVELPEADRACLRAKADPLASMLECNAWDVEPPRLFDTFQTDHPMDARLAAGAPTMADLAGSWVPTFDSEDDRWEIAASGKASHRYGRGRPERYTFTVVANGRLRQKYADGGWSHKAFLLAGPDELYLPSSGTVWPMPSEQEWIVGHQAYTWRDIWIVKDAQGCIEIDDRARTAPADCVFFDRDGRRYLRAQGREFLVLHGYLVDPGVESYQYRRAK